MKNTVTRSLIICLTGTLCANLPCFAQGINVGDSVSCRPFGSQWVSGKVTGKVSGGFTVTVDGHSYVIPDDEHSGSSRIKKEAAAQESAGQTSGLPPKTNSAAADDAFKVGESVMVRPAGSEWFSGRIISKVMGAYQVDIGGQIQIVPDNEHSGSPRIKKGTGGEAPQQKQQQQQQQQQKQQTNSATTNQTQAETAANGPVPPDRPCISCTDGPPGKNGDPPPSTDVLKRLIQCIWERPAPPGSDGAVTVDVRFVNMTGKRINGQGKRNPNGSFTDPLTSDPNRVIYMFDASYIRKTLYQYGTGVYDASHEVFEAYVGLDNKWHMQSASGPNEHRIYYIHKN